MGAGRDAEGAPLAGRRCKRPALLPARRRARLVDTFGQPVGRDLAAAEPAVAGLDHVLRAQIEGVHAQPAGDLVDLALGGKGDLGIAEAAERAEAHAVGVDQLARAAAVRDAIWPAAHEQAVAEHAGAVVAIGAAI